MLDLLAQLFVELVEVDLREQFADRFRAHAGTERLFAKLLLIFAVLLIGKHLLFAQRGRAGVDDDVRRKVQNLFQFLRAHVEQHLHAARNALEIPDVRHGDRELDVAHALAAHLCAGDLDAALIADDALISAALIASAVAFPVLRRSEDPFAEQTVLFGFQCAIVDRFGLLDLAVRPFKDLFRGSQTDLKSIKFR